MIHKLFRAIRNNRPTTHFQVADGNPEQPRCCTRRRAGGYNVAKGCIHPHDAMMADHSDSQGENTMMPTAVLQQEQVTQPKRFAPPTSRTNTRSRRKKNHNCVSQGCTDTRTPGMGQEDVHIPFDCGCATHTTPAFVAFLYDLALRVVVMIPSVSQNLETTKQRGQSWEEM